MAAASTSVTMMSAVTRLENIGLALCKVIIYVCYPNTSPPLLSCLVYLLVQVVNMEFEGGLTAAFSMVAFTEEICKRKTTIYGSKVGLQGMWTEEIDKRKEELILELQEVLRRKKICMKM